MTMTILLALCAGAFGAVAFLAAKAYGEGGFPRHVRYTLTTRECLFDLAVGVAGAVVCVVAAWRW